MRFKRFLSVIVVCVLLFTLSLPAYAAITVGDNGVIYSNLPEPSPDGSSCAFVFERELDNGNKAYYLLMIQLMRVVDASLLGTQDQTGTDYNYTVVEGGNLCCNIVIDYAAPSFKIQIIDGDTLILLSNLLPKLDSDKGFFGYFQMYNLSSNTVASATDFSDQYTYQKTYDWKVTAWKSYGNVVVGYADNTDHSQMRQLPIAWNNSYTDMSVLQYLSYIEVINNALGIEPGATDADDKPITIAYYLEHSRKTYYLLEILLPKFYEFFKAQTDHSANIDNALNGSGNSYADSDLSTIDQYDQLEGELNQDYSAKFEDILNKFDKSNYNMSSFGDGFAFWRTSFESLIVEPKPNIGYILTSFIMFCLLLGLVVFILGKRG